MGFFSILKIISAESVALLALAKLPADLFQNHMDDASKSLLEAEFTEEDVRNAIWSCKVNKSPGSDGFSFGFIKKNWEYLKAKIMGMLKEFHCNRKFVRGMNSSFIVLIPKVDN